MAKKRSKKVKEINLDEQSPKKEMSGVDLLISVIYKMYDNKEEKISENDLIKRSGIEDMEEFEDIVDFFIDVGMIGLTYILKCPECNHTMGIEDPYSRLGPTKTKCQDCGDMIQIIEDYLERGYILNRARVSQYKD